MFIIIFVPMNKVKLLVQHREVSIEQQQVVQARVISYVPCSCCIFAKFWISRFSPLHPWPITWSAPGSRLNFIWIAEWTVCFHDFNLYPLSVRFLSPDHCRHVALPKLLIDRNRKDVSNSLLQKLSHGTVVLLFIAHYNADGMALWCWS